LPETLWKDLTRGQGFWDKKGFERNGWLKEMERRESEMKELEWALAWMDRVEEEEKEKEREREREENRGAGRKSWFSALGEVFRWSAHLEEELEITEVSRVAANANGESRSKLVCVTDGSSDGGMVTAVEQLERELEPVGEEVGWVEVEGCGTATISERDRIQDWIEGVTDATAKPTVWIPPIPRSPPSPSVYSQNLVSDDSIEVAEVYTDGRRHHFLEKRPKVPDSSS
jgi:hypothetical protein